MRATRISPRTLTQPAVASALVALALTGVLYGDVLTLPLFSDDLVQIPWLETISWRELWSGPSPYGYYRPLWYTLWRVWGGLTGGLNPIGLHFLNLVAHFAASWLAGLLAAAWIRSEPDRPAPRIPACLATAVFVTFPFSRQAVAWPGAVYNPLVSAMAAGALLAYDRGRQEYGNHWIGVALLLAALAPLTYEAGLLVGLLVVLAEGIGWLSHRWPRRSYWPLAFAALLPVTLALWHAMRGAGVIGFGLTPADVRRNAGYIVQGLVYPTAPLAQRLAAWQELRPEVCLWLVALPTLALLAWTGLKSNREAFWLGAAWSALFALPPLVSMEADWFALAPRFLYMTAAGGSLMWSAAASGWLARLRPSWRLWVAVALLALLLNPAAAFVREGVRLYAMAGESIWDAAEAAAYAQPMLLVNLPMQITPQDRTYPLGFEGVTPLPMRVTADELVYVHTGIPGAAEAVAFGIAAASEPPGYTYQLFGPAVGWEELVAAARRSHAVYLARYEAERIHLVEAGAYFHPLPSPPPWGEGIQGEGENLLARFEDRVALLAAECTCDEAGRVHLSAYWRVEKALKTDATVFVHLLGPDGTLLAQADGYPLLGMLPFWLWEPGEIVRDVRDLGSVPAGEYTIRLGMWELATGKHWPAAGHPDGTVHLAVRCP